MRHARFDIPLATMLAALLLTAVSAGSAVGVDQVTFMRDKQQQSVAGKLLVTAQDGGLMLMSADGMLWNIEPTEIVTHTHDEEPFAPLSPAEAGKRVQAELPGFQVYTTAHYVICYGTSKVYAQWVGALYERLYNAFSTYWTQRGVKLHDPELPLVVLVFPDQESYAQHTKAELGEATKTIIGFYSLRSNRVTMYDLTGVEAVRGLGGQSEFGGRDQSDVESARGRGDGGHDHPRGDASTGVQPRLAGPLCRRAAVGQRGNCPLFRDARPAKFPRLADRRRGEPSATGPIPPIRWRSGRRNRWNR